MQLKNGHIEISVILRKTTNNQKQMALSCKHTTYTFTQITTLSETHIFQTAAIQG